LKGITSNSKIKKLRDKDEITRTTPEESPGSGASLKGGRLQQRVTSEKLHVVRAFGAAATVKKEEERGETK